MNLLPAHRFAPVRDDATGDLNDAARLAVAWELATWTRALSLWQQETKIELPGARVLEVGAGAANPGLSLWLATLGAQTERSGINSPDTSVRELFKERGLDDKVTFTIKDATSLEVDDEYDVIVFKSFLGAVGRNGDTASQQNVIDRLNNALRPQGELWIAENLNGSPVHKLARRKFGKGDVSWGYPALEEMDTFLRDFSDWTGSVFGITAALGPNPKIQKHLARVDRRFLEGVVPPKWRYVFAAVATK